MTLPEFLNLFEKHFFDKLDKINPPWNKEIKSAFRDALTETLLQKLGEEQEHGKS